MRDLRTNEVAAVSGGTFGLIFSLFSKYKTPAYCAPTKPAPKPEPKCEPQPKYEKPKNGC